VGAAIAHPRFGGIGPAMHLTALALSIDLMVLDHPDHWLKGPEYAPWREGFILIETSSNPIADFWERVKEAVLSYGRPFNGIFTSWKKWSSQVARLAKVAEELRLPTQSPRAYNVATDK